MTSPPSRASVIIPNWNGAHILRPCLEALRNQRYRDFEVIVVDNGSADDSVAMLEQEFPEVSVLALDRNYRFAGGVNRGIQVAQGEIIVLLNNDTEADALWLEALVGLFDRRPEAGMAASKILLFQQPGLLHSAGDYYGLDGVPGNRGVWEEDRGQYDEEAEVFGGCGAAVAYRRSLLEDVGLLDEDLEMYCEDVDLNLRARLAGFRCYFVPEARVYHHLSATGGGPLASYYCGRNFIGVVVKDLPGELLSRYWPRILWAQLRFAVHSLRHFREAAARARLRGQMAAVPLLPRMMRKRRAVLASRRIPLHQFEAWLQAASDHQGP